MKGGYITKRHVVIASAVPISALVMQLIGVIDVNAFSTFINVYITGVAAFIYLSLLTYIVKKALGVEKRRLIYLAIAGAIAIGLCLLDYFLMEGSQFPPLSNIIVAALLYFILLIIAYPHLTKLHELMAKTLVITIQTILATGCFYLVIELFTKNSDIPFTHILVSAFVIVISVTPLKVIMKKIFSYFYPGSQDVFTSLYAFDERLEREKINDAGRNGAGSGS
jgi:hypothetical protein